MRVAAIFYRGFGIGLLCGALIGGTVFWFFAAYLSESFNRTSSEKVTDSELFTRTESGALKRFSHEAYGFTFKYPAELAVAQYPEGAASETIVFQKPGEQYGFQIFITPYGPDEITPERLQQDIRGTMIESPQEVVIGNNLRALIFFSEHPTIGKLREVWFLHNDYLYEVTTYAELDTWIAELLETWEFTEV